MGLNPIKPKTWGQVEDNEPADATVAETEEVIAEPAGWFSEPDSENSEESAVISETTAAETEIADEVACSQNPESEPTIDISKESLTVTTGSCFGTEANPDFVKEVLPVEKVSNGCLPWYKAKDGSFDVISIIQNYRMSFELGSAFKHLIKAEYGYYADNLRKAAWYLEKEAIYLEGFDTLGHAAAIDPIDVIEGFALPYLLGKAVDSLLSYASTGDSAYLVNTIECVATALDRNNSIQ